VIEREKIIPILCNIQKKHLIPIAPFYISSEGEIKSEIIDLVINDFISMGYFVEKDGVIRVSPMSIEIFKEYVEPIPSYEPFLSIKYHRLNTDSYRVKIGKIDFDIKLQASSVTRELTHVLPVTPELGVIFSLPPSGHLFKKAFPLLLEKNRLLTSYVIAPSGKIDLTLSDCLKNQKRIESYLWQTLGKKSFVRKKVRNALRILLFSLLPLSSSTRVYFCDNGHESDFKGYDNYVSAYLASVPEKCNKCYSAVTKEIYIVNNEKIFDDWKNGALMEWFASKLLKEQGLSKTLWNFEINGVQCDALAFNEKKVVVVECKRISSYDKHYYEGLEKLRQIKDLLDPSSLEIKTILMTTIRDQPKHEKDIDKIITYRNFTDFTLL